MEGKQKKVNERREGIKGLLRKAFVGNYI